MTALCARTTATTTLLSTLHTTTTTTLHQILQTTAIHNQTQTRQTPNLQSFAILPLPRQHRGVLLRATPRQSQKSATFHHIIITRTTRIATRCADDEVCVNSLPSSPFCYSGTGAREDCQRIICCSSYCRVMRAGMGQGQSRGGLAEGASSWSGQAASAPRGCKILA